VDTIENAIATGYLRVWADAAAARRPTGDAGGGERVLLADLPAGGAPGGDPERRRPRLRELVASLAPLLDAVPGFPDAGTAVLLAQEDPALAEALAAAVGEAGLGDRLHRCMPSDPLLGGWRPGITLVEGDSAAAAPHLLHAAAAATRALVRLLPRRPGEVEFATVGALAERTGVDLLLRLPLDGVDRLDRYRTTPVADLPLVQRRLAEGVSRLLGDGRWEWLALFRATAAARGAAAGVEAVAERFRTRFAAAAPGAVLRSLDLPGDAGAESGRRLLLATHSAERALALNGVLHALRAAGRIPWPEADDDLVRTVSPGVIELFAGEAPREGGAGGERVRVVDHVALANLLAERFDGGAATLDEVMRAVVERDLLPEEVRRALRLLRRDRRARFRALAEPGEVVRFGASSADARAMPPRRRRGGAEPELW
jgi:hypothetical protein